MLTNLTKAPYRYEGAFWLPEKCLKQEQHRGVAFIRFLEAGPDLWLLLSATPDFRVWRSLQMKEAEKLDCKAGFPKCTFPLAETYLCTQKHSPPWPARSQATHWAWDWDWSHKGCLWESCPQNLSNLYSEEKRQGGFEPSIP